MSKLGQYILIIIISCGLLACASARMAEEVQSGKATFNLGNFKQAFAQLMPLAVKGSCEAQYAIGYMYYYGLGVEPHKESAVFWIKQSADQMYRPAVKAMKMLEKHFKPCPAPVFKSEKQTHAESNLAEYKKENTPQEDPVRMAAKVTPENKVDDILMSLPKPPYKAESKKIKVAEKVEKKVKEKVSEIQKPIELTKAAKDKFTLQLFGRFDLKDMQKLKLQDKTEFARTQFNRYDNVLAYGKSSAIQQTTLAKNVMLTDALRLNPWIRNSNELHWIG